MFAAIHSPVNHLLVMSQRVLTPLPGYWRFLLPVYSAFTDFRMVTLALFPAKVQCAVFWSSADLGSAFAAIVQALESTMKNKDLEMARIWELELAALIACTNQTHRH